MTVMHVAWERNNTEVLETLIKGGANLDFQDKEGCTALHWASERNKVELAKALIK